MLVMELSWLHVRVSRTAERELARFQEAFMRGGDPSFYILPGNSDNIYTGPRDRSKV